MHTKKLISNSPGLVEFVLRLVHTIGQETVVPNGQVKVLNDFFLEEINLVHLTCDNFLGASENDFQASWKIVP